MGAGSRLRHPCIDFCKGGFPRPVLAEQGMDFSLFEREIHLAHRRHATIVLRNLLHRNEASHSSTPSGVTCRMASPPHEVAMILPSCSMALVMPCRVPLARL